MTKQKVVVEVRNPPIITCERCGKEVPNTLYCINCGKPIKRVDELPRIGPRKVEILKTIKRINDQGELATVSNVHDEVGKSSESVRTHMYKLVKSGLLERPVRGQYRITIRGVNVLNSIEVKPR